MLTTEWAWWIWIILGLGLLLGELLTPGGFFIIFFGFGALLVGLLKLLGFAPGLLVEGLIFTIVSLGACAIFRKPLLERFRQLTPDTGPVDSLVGEPAKALEDIAANATGKVELRGTTWNAENLGAGTISKQTVCRVERVNGLTLYVRAQ